MMENLSFRDLSVKLMQTLSLDEMARQLCFFLIDAVPSDRMLWYTVDRTAHSMDVLVDYTRGSTTRSYTRKVPRLLRSKGMKSLRHNVHRDVFVCHRSAAVQDVYRYMRDAFGSFYNSFLCICIPSKEENILQVVFWMSLDAENYTEKHVDFIVDFRPLLQAAADRFFYEWDTVSLSIKDDGVVDRSSEELLRRCKGLDPTMKLVEAVAATKATVLLCGESGVGKEIVAAALHALSHMRQAPLIRVNCGALPENLIDSELFGHERGSFTGASGAHVGFFEQAAGGTLFLDEVGELSLAAQVRLLRALETKEIRRVGGTRDIPVDVRIIAATNRDLWEQVSHGAFREDLLYRLDVFTITIPPLSARANDIPVLAEHFYSRFVHTQGIAHPPLLTRAFIQSLVGLEWPGNVRQLRHAVERSIIFSLALEEKKLGAVDGYVRNQRENLPMNDKKNKRGLVPDEQRIRDALTKSVNRIQGSEGAAKLLGIPPSTLRKYMRMYGIPLPREQRTGKFTSHGE
ncbi:sigma-54 interaction domain-containing protein [Desulfovibrio desulfuricans]|nr:sigma-54 dependent transcriptional regulator [Desulfovibrio desulfuricans]